MEPCRTPRALYRPRPSRDFRLRIAIVGSGPAGFYAAVELLRDRDLPAQVDMFDRLPTPFGLVRTGVAPDRQQIKGVTKKYHEEVDSSDASFRLFANVSVGSDVTISELLERYHAVILATGASADRTLGIPGEELRGVVGATEIVGWYNGHPDFSELQFDLSGERAVVIGTGNVALDVARILARSPEELATTDIHRPALHALSDSKVREVIVAGRGSLARASFTPVELKELANMAAADLVVSSSDRYLDPVTESLLSQRKLEQRVAKNIGIIHDHARLDAREGRTAVRLRFGLRPVEIMGARGKVEAVRFEHTRAIVGNDGAVTCEPTGEFEEVSTHFVARCIGYRVMEVPNVPFDHASAMIPHHHGQVLDRCSGSAVPGLFVTGWAKRGARGIIGSNRPDAAETIKSVRYAYSRGALPSPRDPRRMDHKGIEQLLARRGVRYVSYPDWRLVDLLEVEAGQHEGRPRSKFVTAHEVLEALTQAQRLASGSR